MDNTFKTALNAILRPLVRHLIGRGWTYPALNALLKEAYVAEAESYDDTPEEVTHSRISLLTGIHRKDIKRLREDAARGAEVLVARGTNLAARVIAACAT